MLTVISAASIAKGSGPRIIILVPILLQLNNFVGRSCNVPYKAAKAGGLQCIYYYLPPGNPGPGIARTCLQQQQECLRLDILFELSLLRL